ncbi:MAG: mOMP-like family protein [Parachlamydiales bacterium]|nr:mOMP-like family protein [Parachlamydiales bacterium]
MTKLISSAAAVLAVGSSAFAQTKACPPSSGCTYEQGYGLCGDKFPAAYNAPARIDVQCSWDFFASASFLYWYVDQEGMDIALPVTTATAPYYPSDDQFLMQKFEFKPGFKAAIGMDFDYDNWVGALEYTWLHQETSVSSSSAPAGRFWLMADWFNFGTVATSLSSEWHCNLDLLDLTMSRPYYQGRKLTVLPFFGVRGAWIRQSMHIEATTTPVSTVTPLVSKTHSHSWAIGPRAGVQGHWLLGYGFRIEGDVAASTLFTRYTDVSHDEDNGSGGSLFSMEFENYSTLRPMTEMSIGFGWGSYFDRQNYHFDLLATYDFNVLWGQNMMRSLVNGYQSFGMFQAPDLHIQGLTATARFDF